MDNTKVNEVTNQGKLGKCELLLPAMPSSMAKLLGLKELIKRGFVPAGGVFDANLILANDAAAWSFANLNTSDYGTPVSTTRNAGGFAIIDLGSANIGSAVKGLAVVLVLTAAAADATDALTCIIEESGSATFASDIHELGKFDIAAATKGVILGSEVPATVVMRCAFKERYVRVDASVTAGDNFGTVWAMLSPYPYLRL